MYLTNASISALFRRIELFAALSGLFFAHNSLKINCFHHWDGLYLQDVVKSQLPPSRSLDDFDQLTIGGDAAWAKGPIQVWAELIYSRFEVPNVGPVDTTAYYFEVKYKVSPRFYTAFRWNQQLFSSIDDGGGGTEKWDRDMIKFETALGYRFDNHFQFKLQYSFSDQDGEIEQGQQFVGAQFTIKI